MIQLTGINSIIYVLIPISSGRNIVICTVETPLSGPQLIRIAICNELHFSQIVVRANKFKSQMKNLKPTHFLFFIILQFQACSAYKRSFIALLKNKKVPTYKIRSAITTITNTNKIKDTKREHK